MTSFVTSILCLLAVLPGSTDDKKGKKSTRPVVTIKCYADVALRGTEILLSDVADVECKDTRLAHQLGQLKLANRPSHRHHRTFSHRDITNLIRREQVPLTLKVSGATEIVAQPLADLVTREEIIEIAEDMLNAVIDENLEDHDIERVLQSKVIKMYVPPGRQDMHLEAKLRNGKIGRHTATIDVTVMVDGKPYAKKPLNFRLSRYAEMLVAKRPIKRGDQLTQYNLELKRMPLGSGTDMSLRSFDIVFDRVASININRGQPLSEGHLAKPALIHANQPVTLIIKSRHVRITMSGTAMANGALGEPILVRKSSGGEPLRGLVYGRNTVIIPTGR